MKFLIRILFHVELTFIPLKNIFLIKKKFLDDAMDSRAIEDTNNEANTDLSDSHNKGIFFMVSSRE